ncbi:MAG: DUF3990 domain-containing protein [Alphaproteobacteria bacterium]|nr:MAG: DUF3990 domain-containing protein [Alphaproteobacteria bacterium]
MTIGLQGRQALAISRAVTAEPSLIRTLYHGTTRASAQALCGGGKVDLARCSQFSDFGRGFYMTSNPDQARTWATVVAGRPRNVDTNGAAVIATRVDFSDLSKLRILAFANTWAKQDYNGFWSVIEWCRKGNKLPDPGRRNEPWDIVIGQVAYTWGPARPREVFSAYDQVAFVSDRSLDLLTKQGFWLV